MPDSRRPGNEENRNQKDVQSPARRRLLLAGAALGGSSSLRSRFPFLKSGSANMLNQAPEGIAQRTESKRGQMSARNHVAVIGAGAFGGWTALYLRRRGARVTLLDAWGPGNSRASSGGETRVIRGTYGPNQPYTRMAARATQLWKENERRWNLKLMYPIGVLWMVAAADDQFEKGSLPGPARSRHPLPRAFGTGTEVALAADQSGRCALGIHEPEGGFLTARVACQAVLEGFLAEGGEYKQLATLSRNLEESPWDSLSLSDGSKLEADQYVFACGPWLGQMFPQTIGNRIHPHSPGSIFLWHSGWGPKFQRNQSPRLGRSPR